jgi:hypothetical protein
MHATKQSFVACGNLKPIWTSNAESKECPKLGGARSLKRSIYTSRARQGAWKIATDCQPWKSRSHARQKTTSPGTANELQRAVQTSDSRMYGSYTGSPSRPVGSPCPYCELRYSAQSGRWRKTATGRFRELDRIGQQSAQYPPVAKINDTVETGHWGRRVSPHSLAGTALRAPDLNRRVRCDGA